MQILIPDSWLREYLATDATPQEIQNALSLCGPSVERLHKVGSDFVYDIEVTTNRVDMMSVYGIAREAAVILPRFGHQAKLLSDPFDIQLSFKTSPSVDYLQVKLDHELCQRFSATLIRGVKVAPSPDWLAKKLETVGMRGLNNVVDISNLLMHELGQPVHTFDYNKVAGATMILRESRVGESITTLDGKTHKLPGHDIVIEDGRQRLIDLCGIMGGANSAVDEHTTNVLLFVQTYEPVHIRKTSMSLAHRTEAAVLFEKGLAVESVLPTLEKGIQLFKDLAGGQPVNSAIDICRTKTSPHTITVTPEFINSRLGIELTAKDISGILTSLGFTPQVPWWRRIDVTIPEDIVEEVARIYGYHNLPSEIMTGPLPTQRDDSEFYWISKIKSALKHWGLTETYSYSLTPADAHPNALKLKNPLSDDWKCLRTSLGPSLRTVIQENLGRVPELNLFEIANVYIPQKSGLPAEIYHLAIATSRKDWFYLKGIIEGLFNYELGITAGFNENKEVTLYDDCLTFEIDISSQIARAKKVIHYRQISKFSPIIEDVNIKIAEKYPDLVTRLHKLSPLVKNVEFIDKFEDKLTLRLTYHSDSNQLSSKDIAPIRSKITSLLGRS